MTDKQTTTITGSVVFTLTVYPDETKSNSYEFDAVVQIWGCSGSSGTSLDTFLDSIILPMPESLSVPNADGDPFAHPSSPLTFDIPVVRNNLNVSGACLGLIWTLDFEPIPNN